MLKLILFSVFKCTVALEPSFQGAMIRLSILTAERLDDDKTVLFEERTVRLDQGLLTFAII